MLTYFTLFFFRGDVGGWRGVVWWRGVEGEQETTESADDIGYEPLPETKMTCSVDLQCYD